MLIDTADLVTYVAAAHVYPSGVLFTLSSRSRPTACAEAEESFAQEFALGGSCQVPAAQAERYLRVGVRFADGRAGALNANFRWLPHFEPDQDTPPLVRTARAVVLWDDPAGETPEAPEKPEAPATPPTPEPSA